MKITVFAIGLSTLFATIVVAAPPGVTQPQFVFQAYDGDPKKTDPKHMHFQLSCLDVRQRTEFLKLGETVRDTKFKLTRFQFKTRIHPQHGEEDASELTLVNTATNETVVLTIAPRVHAVSKTK